jgi:hypothetical protein
MMTKKAPIRLVMSGLVAGGLALAAGASGKTLGALYQAVGGDNGFPYVRCGTNDLVFAESIGYTAPPSLGGVQVCNQVSTNHNQWFYNTGCSSSATWHRPRVRTNAGVLPGQNNQAVQWTSQTFSQVNISTEKWGYPSTCVTNRQTIAWSSGS